MGTRIVVISTLRFFYAVTLHLIGPRNSFQPPRKIIGCRSFSAHKRSYSYCKRLRPHHVIFSTMYGTGMRVSEAVRAADGTPPHNTQAIERTHRDYVTFHCSCIQ